MTTVPSDAIALGLTAISSLVLWTKHGLSLLADGAHDGAADAAGGPAACAAAAAARQGTIELAAAASAVLLLALSLSHKWRRWRRWAVPPVRLALFAILPWEPPLCAAPSCAAADAVRVLVGE